MSLVTVRSSPDTKTLPAPSIADRLRDDIVRGDIYPGERLNEADLSGRYGVSRTPIREAIRQLEQEGLVVVQRYRGASVVKLTRTQIASLFETREAIEGMAAQLATTRMPATTAQRLFTDLNDHAEALRAGADLRPPFDVHQAILDASENEFLVSTMARLQSMLATLRAESVRVVARRSQSSREHLAILDAISKGDAIAAEQAMRAHVRSVKRNVLGLQESES